MAQYWCYRFTKNKKPGITIAATSYIRVVVRCLLIISSIRFRSAPSSSCLSFPSSYFFLTRGVCYVKEPCRVCRFGRTESRLSPTFYLGCQCILRILTISDQFNLPKKRPTGYCLSLLTLHCRLPPRADHPGLEQGFMMLAGDSPSPIPSTPSTKQSRTQQLCSRPCVHSLGSWTNQNRPNAGCERVGTANCISCISI